MVKFDEISFSYGDKKILENISLDFEKGNFTCILGRNGCGKSTIVKAISRQIIPNSGKILYFNEEIEKIEKKKFAQKVSFLLQFNENIEDVTVQQFISFGRTPFKSIFKSLTSEDYEIINKNIERTFLKGFENRKLSTLSGGEKQRVYLAMCLTQQPEMIILDEPMNHLDIKFQYELLNLIKKINKESETTIVCILHDINQAIKYADKLILLKEGEVFVQGSVEKCITKENILEVFGIDVDIYSTVSGIRIDYIV